MVAIIKTGYSINRILNYNEQKVREGVAHCIAAMNYPKDVEDLTFENKLNRMLHQSAMNENVSRNSVHISLNFDPSEQLSPTRLAEISEAYMRKIGFGEQPYLVYQHLDAGHPHVHLVSIKIRRDGSRIETQNIGRNQSQKAIKEIEQAYGLLHAEGYRQKQIKEHKQTYVERVQYGKKETKKAISSVVQWVVQQYKFTSLEELNAVLRTYNVMADKGSVHSRIHQHTGLVYRIIDAHGNKKGVPIKASAIEGKPTLKLLQEKFRQNITSRLEQERRVRNVIDLALLKNKHHSLQSLEKSLEKEGIVMIMGTRKCDHEKDFFYVDHKTQCVFTGGHLGSGYSVIGIRKKCYQEQEENNKELTLRQTGNQFSIQRIIMQEDLLKKQQQTPVANHSKALNQSLPPILDGDAVTHKPEQRKNKKRISHHL